MLVPITTVSKEKPWPRQVARGRGWPLHATCAGLRGITHQQNHHTWHWNLHGSSAQAGITGAVTTTHTTAPDSSPHGHEASMALVSCSALLQAAPALRGQCVWHRQPLMANAASRHCNPRRQELSEKPSQRSSGKSCVSPGSSSDTATPPAGVARNEKRDKSRLLLRATCMEEYADLGVSNNYTKQRRKKTILNRKTKLKSLSSSSGLHGATLLCTCLV